MKFDFWSLMFKILGVKDVEEKEITGDNIKKYYSLHDNVINGILKNKKDGKYDVNPITKKLNINILSEAAKILTKKDYNLYEKYYTHFHGGNGKKMVYDSDLFKANPNHKFD